MFIWQPYWFLIDLCRVPLPAFFFNIAFINFYILINMPSWVSTACFISHLVQLFHYKNIVHRDTNEVYYIYNFTLGLKVILFPYLKTRYLWESYFSSRIIVLCLPIYLFHVDNNLYCFFLSMTVLVKVFFISNPDILWDLIILIFSYHEVDDSFG